MMFIRATLFLSLILPLAAMPAPAPGPTVLLLSANAGDSNNYGLFGERLALSAPTDVRMDGTLPGGDLSSVRLIVITTNLDAYVDHADRLKNFVQRGGRLLVWFADDRYSRRGARLLPYNVVFSDTDTADFRFLSVDHPLTHDLADFGYEKEFCGGDVVTGWDFQHWQALAISEDGATILSATYGQGEVAVAQVHFGLSRRADVANRLARNALLWAGIEPLRVDRLAKRPIKQVISAIAHHQMHELVPGKPVRGTWEEVQAAAPPQGVWWNYPWGVRLYGMLRVSEVLKDREVEAFVLEHNRLAAEHHDYLQWQKTTFGKFANPAGLQQIMALTMLDHCGAMSNVVMEGLLKHNGPRTPETERLMARVADYIENKQSRLPDGTLYRPEANRTLWIDDLYMSCPFLIRYSELTGDPRYINDAAKQVIRFASYTQDSDGLYYHGWFEETNRTSPFKWGRADGWALVTSVEVLSRLPENHPDRPAILAIMKKQIDGLLAVQAPSGMWRQVLNYPDLWEETSCTSMFAYSIARAVNRGWIEKTNLAAARRAWQAVSMRVSPDGIVFGTCVGTGISDRLEDYIQRPASFDDGHGPGTVMLLGAELIEAGVK